MQAIEKLLKDMTKFYVDKETEHARHNFSELLTLFDEEVTPKELHDFLGEMIKIYENLSSKDIETIKAAILSVILNIQMRPLVHKVLSFPKVYFDTI